jgi:hypothetical protein
MAVTIARRGLIAEADMFLKHIRSLVKSTYRSGVLGILAALARFHLNTHKFLIRCWFLHDGVGQN